MVHATRETIRNVFEWGSIEWLVSSEVGNSRELSLGRMRLEPGMATETHVHANCEESIYVLRGTVRCRLGADEIALGAGERSVVPRGSVHAIRNATGESAELLLCYSAAVRAYARAS